MDPSNIGELIQGGGAVALAVFVAWELRAFRTDLKEHLRALSEGIAVLLDRSAD